MKKGFTMIELIFVIVILGILAAVAIPRLAATRDDAAAAAIKTDVGAIGQAVPAWYQGQQDARIAQAVSIDTSKWVKSSTTESYTWSEGSTACVTIAVYDMNISNPSGSYTAADSADINSTGGWTGTYSPVLRIIKTDGNRPPAAASTTICKMLWNEMGLTEQNISMGGQRVKW